jgi:ATP-dependent helicase Lhr and Lhr-like helicase
MSMSPFHPATRAWFQASFAAPTQVQTDGWRHIANGEHALLLAPTGSGKTLAAFLWALDKLGRLPAETDPGVRVLYISPLKALVYDIERNLRAPLIGMQRFAQQLGQPLRPVAHGVRTGDTSQKDRRLFTKKPPEVFITTPESLYLVLTSNAREVLRTVDTVIVDEIHTMAGSKRGAHLALSLERLSALTDVEPQRIGLSATQRPLERIARYLGGDRKVAIVDASQKPDLELHIEVPVPDMEQPWMRRGVKIQADGTFEDYDHSATPAGTAAVQGNEDSRSIWPAIHPRLLELIQSHNSTIVFANSRLLCERLAQRLNELAQEELVLAHHGSVAHERRTMIEERLKTGDLKGIVATSSLELGIDMGAVDLVLQIESPGSVARGLQRVGRAGHGVGQRSEGRIFPKYRGDLLEAAAVAQHMLQGRIEETQLPRNPLDVLSQQIVAMACLDDWKVDDALALVKRTASFSELTPELFHGVLDMLSGRYPSEDFAELRPRIRWDRDTDTLHERKGSRMLAVFNAGTIPDRGLYTVHVGSETGPRVGELDEEMVYESRRGQVFMLGASTWRIQEITRDRVVVTPAPGEPGRMPFWRGQGPGRPIELGRALGEFSRELGDRSAEDATTWLREQTPLDELAAKNLVAYVRDQRVATGAIPSDRTLVVERFRDDLGDWRVAILSPYGSRVHAPWALAIDAILSEHTGLDVQSLWTDDGILLRFADVDELPDLDLLMPDPDDVQERILAQLDQSAVFAGRFREAAARALLLPRRRPDKRTPLWQQRLRAQNLMAAVVKHPGFPILLETYRECLQEVFNMPALLDLLGRIRRREVRIVHAETNLPSPFAKSLVFAYVATYLYEGDAPLAERKAAALTLDRALLAELLGQEQLRELLDPEAVAAVEAELQYLEEDRHVAHSDALHHLLRRLGAMTLSELQARAKVPVEPLLATLHKHALQIRFAGQDWWVAVEDAARYRDALGAVLPPGLPQAFILPVDDPLRDLVMRYGRTHGPFTTAELSGRLGLLPAQVLSTLRALEAEGKLHHGEIRPGGSEREWVDPAVLRRIRRRTLAALRSEISAVDAAAMGRFLPRWHGLGSKGRGLNRLEEVLDQLEGLALPLNVWERQVLPERMADFNPNLLDQLGAAGSIVWIGRGATGPRTGRIALVRREHVPLLLEPPSVPADLSEEAMAILEHLETRGASFFVELAAAGKSDDVLDALWDLVWKGLVTNDTFQPLRALTGKRKKATTRRRTRRVSGAALAAGGRWSLVKTLFYEECAGTERAHARATMLLDRYGVVSRDAALAEQLPGGFAALYGVLSAMEEAGRVRRGWFVEGLAGAQFAMPGAVDALRAVRHDDEGVYQVLSAVDPACPWGTLLPWPSIESATLPKRLVGAAVLLRDGQPMLWVAPSGKRAVVFEDLDAAAVVALRRRSSRFFDRTVEFEQINGLPVADSPHRSMLQDAGFEWDGRLLRLVDF